MSENVNPIPIGLWSLAVGAQLATAIIDLWKWNLNRRRSLTGFEKTLNGEKILGWKIAISSECFRKKHGRCKWQSFVCPYWPLDENENPHSSLSLLVHVIESMPDGRKSVSLCRYMLVATDVSSTIMQIVYDERNYRFTFGAYVTNRIVATVFCPMVIDMVFDQESPYRLILIDTISKSYRRLTISRPIQGAFLYAICPGDVSKRRINALFLSSDWPPPALRAEFYEVPYEMPISNENIDVALSTCGWQSISVPVDVSTYFMSHIGIGPQAIVLYDYDHLATDSARVVTYDRNRNWRIENLQDRIRALQWTRYGPKLFYATGMLDSLPLPNRFFYRMPRLRHFKNVSEYHIGGSLFFSTRNDSLLHRFLCPPTLKRMSADAFCRSTRIDDLISSV